MNDETRVLHENLFDSDQKRMQNDEVLVRSILQTKVVDNGGILERARIEVRHIMEYWQARFNDNPHSDNYKMMELCCYCYQHLCKNVRKN